MKQVMDNAIDYTLKSLKKNKITQADIIVSGSDKLSLKSEKGELSEYAKSKTHSLGVRIINKNKVGISFTEDFSDWAIDQTINNALNNSKFAKNNDYISIESREVFNEDDTTDSSQTDTSELIDKVIYMEQAVEKKDSRAKTPPYNGLSEVTSYSVLANTKGSRCSYKTKYYSSYTSCLLSDKEKNSMHYQYDVSKNFEDLNFDALVDEVHEISSQFLDAGQIKSGSYLVKFSPDLLNTFFSSFSSLYSGKSVMDELSPWRDKLNETVTDERLTISDISMYEDSLSKIPFDMEGNKKRDIHIVKEGKLSEFLHNSETAKKLKMENNFCASRGPKSPLSVSSSNTVITASKTAESLNDITYVEILSAQGLHSGISRTSGNISLGVSGRVIENGKVKYYFKDSTVSGNFFQMLKNIHTISSKNESSRDKSFFSPEIIFDELTFAGS